jgi:type I restriction-modification system DNA methylase subunit
VYYTPTDVVRFILTNSIKFESGVLNPSNISNLTLDNLDLKEFVLKKSIYDPTCGTGAFLIETLNLKLDLLSKNPKNLTKSNIFRAVKTIRGNDLNPESILITKVRMFLTILNRFNPQMISGLSEVLNISFTSFNFVTDVDKITDKYDIIIGNPPYVEDRNSGLIHNNKYGNIYANVLENSSLLLKEGGVLGFIIPLSFISTPRMGKIRDRLYINTPNQYILNYSDRPDSLFVSVHQKLCIILARKDKKHNTSLIKDRKEIYTSNYKYWYKDERADLFKNIEVVKNDYILDGCIPKLGNNLDVNIYEKVINNNISLRDILEGNNLVNNLNIGNNKENNTQLDNTIVYLNMRATFWIKAFKSKHEGAEYKEFNCFNEDVADFSICLLNSSLFWWYWICVSDCWHITNKELSSFTIPYINNLKEFNELAKVLEDRLEETKLYVGTKQTEYEYKHKSCIKEIHKIDDYINKAFNLTKEESIYIKNFSLKYRTGGQKDERN